MIVRPVSLVVLIARFTVLFSTSSCNTHHLLRAEIRRGSVRPIQNENERKNLFVYRFGHGRDNRVIVQRQISVLCNIPSAAERQRFGRTGLFRRGIIDGKADLLCIYLGVCHVGAVRDKRPAVARPYRDGGYLDRTGGVVDDGGIDCCVNCTVLRYRQREVRGNRYGKVAHEIPAVVAGTVAVCVGMVAVVIAGIAAVAGFCPAVLGIGIRLPFTVGEGMRFIRRGGISAGGTLRCYLVLGVGNALTGDGQTVIRVFRRGVSLISVLFT